MQGKITYPNGVILDLPCDVKELFCNGDITNSDLEMAGLLILWLVIEEVFP